MKPHTPFNISPSRYPRFAQMTNSKQCCEYCGERWSALHSACRPNRRPQTQTQSQPRSLCRLFDATGKRLSTVLAVSDGKLVEISPLTSTVFASDVEWKAAYPTGTVVKMDTPKADGKA